MMLQYASESFFYFVSYLESTVFSFSTGVEL